MKDTKPVFLLWAAVLGAAPAAAGEISGDDRTLSPYFLVKGDDPAVDQLPLLSTDADVDIAGVIADVKVTQTYKNDGKRPIEAIYVFPASTRAAVYGLKMTVGQRTIVAEIREREKARQEYEQARQQGKSASLLEQERPNVFQMNVANIMPGDRIEVELSYTELLVPTEGVYEFDYPTVVGPRYSNLAKQDAPQSENWVANPYQHEGERPAYAFGIAVNLDAGMPIQDISCPSHKTRVAYNGLSTAAITLDPSERYGGNRDFILKYRLAGKKVQSGLLLYEGKDENFFLMMMQPPKRVETDEIPPREYIFIMDVSGSMHGYPIDISKKLLRDLISNLRRSDVFNVLLFSGGNRVMSDVSLPATQENIEQAMQVIDHEQGGGGTELLPALTRALALPRTKSMSRTVVIATDGYVRVEAEAFDLIRSSLGKANMFAFGIGTSVNRQIIEGMAHVGMGEPFVITKPDEADAQAEKFRRYINSPVLTQVSADFQGFETYDVEPPAIPDVLAERPVIVFGKWRGSAEGEIVVSGRTADGAFKQTFRVQDFEPDMANSALRYLWARHRIQILADYNNLQASDERVKEVTSLGLSYNLLTQYTSFVAVDSRIRNVGGKQTVVRQALPMPEGVSDLAVGGRLSKAQINGLGRLDGGSGGAYATAPSMECLAEPRMAARSAAATTRVAEQLQFAKDKGAGKAEAGAVKLGRVDVRGGATQKEVKAGVESLLTVLTGDYRKALAGQPGLKGNIEVKLMIAPDGSTTNVKVVTNELNQDLADEVTKLISALSFRNFSGALVSVTVRFSFSP